MNIAFDIHCGIIKLLDYDAIISYKQVNKQANALVHIVYKRFYQTGNIYDAARNNDILNFERLAHVTPVHNIVEAIYLTTSYEITTCGLSVIDKNDIITTYDISYNLVLTGHKIPYEECTLSAIDELICNGHVDLLHTYPRTSTYNISYALMGLYDYIVPSPNIATLEFACAAFVSKDSRIIALANKEAYNIIVNIHKSPNQQEFDMIIGYRICYYAIITNDIDLFGRMYSYNTCKTQLIGRIIDYDRVSFMAHVKHIEPRYIDDHVIRNISVAMMAQILKIVGRDDARYIAVRTYNYSIIELYNKQYTPTINVSKTDSYTAYIPQQ